ncbi:MAG: hypothetical protein ACTHQ3_18185 [Motilibacteraceae bacterium]
MARPSRRRPSADQHDVELAAGLDQALAAARDAERALATAEAEGADLDQLAALRRAVGARYDAAVAAADANYRVALGPTDGVKRVAVLARWAKAPVQEAERLRNQVTMARSHWRMATRDELGVVPVAAVPPSVGTAAIHLATHADEH